MIEVGFLATAPSFVKTFTSGRSLKTKLFSYFPPGNIVGIEQVMSSLKMGSLY